MNIFENKFYKVTDLENNIICSGIVINHKENCGQLNGETIKCYCISFDNKIYFRLDSKNIKIYESAIETSILFNINNYNLKYCNWRDASNNLDCDFYIENDITQLDEEVKSLVYSINKLNDIETVGSCSGHNKSYLWVDIKFKSNNISSLKNFIKIISRTGFILETNDCIENNCEGLILKLRSVDIGKQAYIKADRLSKRILSYSNIGG